MLGPLVLVCNLGSATIKLSLHEDPAAKSRSGSARWMCDVDTTTAVATWRSHGRHTTEQWELGDRTGLLDRAIRSAWEGPSPGVTEPHDIDLVGHRVVHGGADFRVATRIDAEVERSIETLAAFAPLHNPWNLEGVHASQRLLPHAEQMAVFDTAFHSTLPVAAYTLPGPAEWTDRGIRRFGFHGISHQHAAYRAAELLERPVTELRIVTCHLGSGASLAAVLYGHSVDTTMGFTPLDGIPMGTRPGALDPGVLVHLLRTDHLSVGQLDDLLQHRCGLAGMGGHSGDMRLIEAAAEVGDAPARIAYDVFVLRTAGALAAMTASLRGLDAVVFTGGIGEHSWRVRRDLAAALPHLGLTIDAQRNLASDPDRVISTSDASVAIAVVRADENSAIAHECLNLLARPKSIVPIGDGPRPHRQTT